MSPVFEERETRALFTLTNVFVMFGGSKDGAFNQEISDLVGPSRVFRTNWHTDAMAGHTFSGEDIVVGPP
jgi:type IV secretion system protein VirD4